MGFYGGPTVLERLETIPIDADRNLDDLRFPVQLVLRPSLDYRAYAGQIASGVVRAGDHVMVLPSRKETRVAAIDFSGRELPEAFAPMSVALRLADEIDVSRGDMLVHVASPPRRGPAPRRHGRVARRAPARPRRSYLLKHTTQTVRAQLEGVRFKVDLETLANVPADALGLNDIGRIGLVAHRPLFVDAYAKNRAIGAFILIDSLTNDTVAAGIMLESQEVEQGGVSPRTPGRG